MSLYRKSWNALFDTILSSNFEFFVFQISAFFQIKLNEMLKFEMQILDQHLEFFSTGNLQIPANKQRKDEFLI